MLVVRRSCQYWSIVVVRLRLGRVVIFAEQHARWFTLEIGMCCMQMSCVSPVLVAVVGSDNERPWFASSRCDCGAFPLGSVLQTHFVAYIEMFRRPRVAVVVSFLFTSDSLQLLTNVVQYLRLQVLLVCWDVRSGVATHQTLIRCSQRIGSRRVSVR